MPPSSFIWTKSVILGIERMVVISKIYHRILVEASFMGEYTSVFMPYNW